MKLPQRRDALPATETPVGGRLPISLCRRIDLVALLRRLGLLRRSVRRRPHMVDIYTKCSREMVEHVCTIYIVNGIKSCFKSFLRTSEKEGLQGEVDDMSDTSYAAPFRIEIDLPDFSINLTS